MQNRVGAWLYMPVTFFEANLMRAPPPGPVGSAITHRYFDS
ncbi:protein of unknown function [Methanoculleus bourgensis]|uniref:Uncharacterized protein n=1 Tax=Methanoculleus bourgensis TaxID=83986 RepID=A0A0X3BPT1_9EURY|nr:protein of unknown function [Methanoculleus bourgensis]